LRPTPPLGAALVYCFEQTVEVVEIGRVAAHAGHVPANQPDGLIERASCRRPVMKT
jgi:hypothetical protein